MPRRPERRFAVAYRERCTWRWVVFRLYTTPAVTRQRRVGWLELADGAPESAVREAVALATGLPVKAVAVAEVADA